MGRDKGDEEDEGRGRLGLERGKERKAADSQNSRFFLLQLLLFWSLFREF